MKKNLVTNKMLNFEIITKIFSDFFNNPGKNFEYNQKIEKLVWLNIKTNRTLWDLEDLARLIELGDRHVSNTKRKIDKNNQTRNDLIRKMDMEIVNLFSVSPGSQENFYSESPGMIIDRLAIIFIKLSVIQNLLSVIQEDDLKKEYKEKKDILLNQIDRIGDFLDSYFSKLASKEVFFEVQQHIKIYNDKRVKKYIKIIK
ncbi:DUF4254 domain-containing protein [Patescibacteria group bacterium]|nr:DUF4254 domain-containing protein [Patescibacteria group bacterium]